MAKYYYNGVLLPEIPADVLSSYPYCWIRNNYRTGHYDLLMASSPWYASNSDTISTANYAEGIQWYRIQKTTAENAAAWEFNQVWNTSGGFGAESDRSIMWANYDVPAGSPTTGIYFIGSEPVPEETAHEHSYTAAITTAATCTTAGVKTFTCECGDSYTEEIPATGHSYVNGVCTVCGAADPDYNGGGTADPEPDDGSTVENYQIERATLEGLGDQVRRLCNVEGVLQPPKMAELLEGLNIDLEEVYISATTEEQTITPSEGYYGFFKIVVEAVEEDDGGGSGTGGGGTGESYPDAESTTFGCEYVESTVLTGRYTYNLNNGSKLGPITGFPVVYAYQYMDYSSISSKFNVYQTEEPLVYYNGGLYPPSPCKYIGYSYDSTNDEWTELGSGTVTSYMALTGFRWANYTIGMRNEEGVFYTGSQAIPETTTGAVAQPLAREDTYTISGNTLNSIGASVQQITGIDATTPAGMAAALQSYFGLNTDTTE